MSAGKRFSLEAARRTREMRSNLPVFSPKNRPIFSESSPHMLMWDDLLTQFGNDEQRRKIVNMLDWHIDNLKRHGIIVDALLVGGSFVIPDLCPSDIDALLFYRIAPKCNVKRAIDFLRTPTPREIDLRYAPQDADVSILVKMISFFTLLYSYNVNTERISSPIFIIQI